jgi:hypothetical protein
MEQPAVVPFDSLSPEQRRVLIAQDVIAAINARRIVPARGIYLTSDKAIAVKGENMREALGEHPQCTACAVGAVFVAAVERFNNAIANEYMHRTSLNRFALVDLLGIYFSNEQLALIEIAFECMMVPLSVIRRANVFEDVQLQTETQRAIDFGNQRRAQDHEQNTAFRMIAIMENIIQNNGTFIP